MDSRLVYSVRLSPLPDAGLEARLQEVEPLASLLAAEGDREVRKAVLRIIRDVVGVTALTSGGWRRAGGIHDNGVLPESIRDGLDNLYLHSTATAIDHRRGAFTQHFVAKLVARGFINNYTNQRIIVASAGQATIRTTGTVDSVGLDSATPECGCCIETKVRFHPAPARSRTNRQLEELARIETATQGGIRAFAATLQESVRGVAPPEVQKIQLMGVGVLMLDQVSDLENVLP